MVGVCAEGVEGGEEPEDSPPGHHSKHWEPGHIHLVEAPSPSVWFEPEGPNPALSGHHYRRRQLPSD